MTRPATAALIALLSTIPCFAAGVLIELDYTARPCWSYAMDYRSDCIIVENGTTVSMKTNVVCAMSARPIFKADKSEPSRMEFTADSVAVTSELFKQEQRENIVRKLTGATFGLALFGGAPVVDTLSTFSVGELSEWDMVIQFSKLLPFIPTRSVRKGYSWEESAIHPLMTALGKVPCEVYRLYKVDSLSARDTRVHISWQFKYGAMRKAIPDSSLLRKVPITGKGTGSAIIDLTTKALLQANVEFRTPVAEYSGTRVIWVENTVLKLKPDATCPAQR